MPKYFAFRDAIAHATGVTPLPVPEVPKLSTLPAATFTLSASLWKNLPAPRNSEHPLSMEDVGQGYGYILYRTTLKDPVSGTLDLGVMHQYAQVFVNGTPAGVADRRLHQTSIKISSPTRNAQLDILIENTGRINFGPRILGERIGLLTDVSIAGKTLTGWNIYSLPMQSVDKLRFVKSDCTGPCFYRAILNVTRPVDTYVDTRELGKGEMWIDGHNLGRFWDVGPQGALYLPASWLKAGANDVVIFDLDAAPGRSIRGIDRAVINLGSTPSTK